MTATRLFVAFCLGLLLLTSCHSSRTVVRGDQGRVIERNDKGKSGKKDDAKTKLTGQADNKFTRSLLDEAYSWLGTPYKYGGNTKDGADCSGFVMMVYKSALDISLPRVSREQGEFCRKINKKDLFPGDLVFFITGNGDKVNHVGLYVGDGKFIHASSSKGIIVSDLDQQYYINAYHHSGLVESYHKMLKRK